MLKVFQEGARVLIDLVERRKDVLLSCNEAYNLEQAMRSAANGAEQTEAKEGVTPLTEVWGAKVQSYDGTVAIRFFPPTIGHPTRVQFTAAAARKFADTLRFTAQQAAYKMRFESKPIEPRKRRGRRG